MTLSPYRIKYYASELISIISLWIFGALLCVYIKFNDIPEAAIKSIYNFQPWMNKSRLYLLALLISSLIGLLMGLTHTFLYPLIIRTRSFLLNILLRFVVFLALTLSTLTLFYSLSGLPALDFSKKSSFKLTTSVIDVFIYLVLIELIIGLTITLRRNLGNTYLTKLIRHAYFTPRDEYRVFMFTDLKNSTGMVEKMGSLFFSRFIQECFKDLSNVALDHGGEVYQFVGDEAVITWKVTRNFDHLNCIRLHLALCDRLRKKKELYLKTYGAFPEFRTSIHSGNVSVALVGEYKTEIAYHGGALNLCSRLQSVCRAYEADLVISENFYKHIAADSSLKYEPITDIELKGIAEKQLVYKVY